MNIYQEEILDHHQRPRNYGTVTDPDASATRTNPLCGDALTLSLRITDGHIEEIRFTGEGCAISLAAASMLTEAITSQTVDEARVFTDRKMLETVGVELTPARQKCGLLAVSALREALGKSE